MAFSRVAFTITAQPSRSTQIFSTSALIVAGLMWAETYLGGHTQPENQPRASYMHLGWLLGNVDIL